MDSVPSDAQRQDDSDVLESPMGESGAAGQNQEHAQYARRRVRPSMWKDPLVQGMGLFALALVIGSLAFILSALYFGLIGTDAPRTVYERDLIQAQATASKSNSVEDWQNYVLMLIEDEQYTNARKAIDQGNAKKAYDQTRGANMLFCTAELQKAEGDNKTALKTYKQVMDKTEKAYDKELKRGGTQNWAMSFGVHDNYYLSALQRSAIYQEMGKLKEAVKMLDVYLTVNPQQSAILANRGDLKAKLGDKKGAEKDYREALRYVPDLPEALKGLKTIGADK